MVGCWILILLQIRVEFWFVCFKARRRPSWVCVCVGGAGLEGNFQYFLVGNVETNKGAADASSPEPAGLPFAFSAACTHSS